MYFFSFLFFPPSSSQVFAVIFIALSTAYESPLSQDLISISKCLMIQYNMRPTAIPASLI